MKKPRFTLTELLVIIALIASLACLALPIGTQIGEKERAAHESSNLRQVGVSTAAYVVDHNGQVFSSATPGGWPSALHSKYVPNWKTFKSPFDKRPDGTASSTGAGVPVSYGINAAILAQSAAGGNAFDGDVTRYSSPDQLIYMAPNVDPSQTLLVFIPGTGDSNIALNAPAKAPAMSNENRGTHGNRSQITVLFADYHTANITYRDFATTSGAGGAARWQPIHTP
jgi:type II secretory pathway pseudopilin PulG